MSFTPIVPFSGAQGWAFLSRTIDAQKEAHANSSEVERNIETFREKISTITSAEDLVADREVLLVSLTAFGLEDDINNRFFIKKILEEGTLNEDSLANRFTDKRYLQFSKAFGFGDFDVPRTVLSDFADEITDRYLANKFEAAVGDVDADMRLALAFDDDMMAILEKDTSEDTRWLEVLGSSPLKSTFEEAFFLPAGFGNLTLDRQIEILKDSLSSKFGSDDINLLKDATARDRLRSTFLMASQLSQSSISTGASTALSLLQSSTPLRF